MLGSTQVRQERHLIRQMPLILVMQQRSPPLSMTQQPMVMQPAHTMQRRTTRQDRLPTALLTLQEGTTPLNMSQLPGTTQPRRSACIMRNMSTVRQKRLPTGLLLAGKKLSDRLHLPQVPTFLMSMHLHFKV